MTKLQPEFVLSALYVLLYDNTGGDTYYPSQFTDDEIEFQGRSSVEDHRRSSTQLRKELKSTSLQSLNFQPLYHAMFFKGKKELFHCIISSILLCFLGPDFPSETRQQLIWQVSLVQLLYMLVFIVSSFHIIIEFVKLKTLCIWIMLPAVLCLFFSHTNVFTFLNGSFCFSFSLPHQPPFLFLCLLASFLTAQSFLSLVEILVYSLFSSVFFCFMY